MKQVKQKASDIETTQTTNDYKDKFARWTYNTTLLKNFTWNIEWKVIGVHNTFDKA